FRKFSKNSIKQTYRLTALNKIGSFQLHLDSETAIMHRLQDRILEHSKHILRAHQFAAEMDCLCAFAQAASSMKGVRPKLVQESLIRITNGWHPIQQLLSIDTIRNSFFSGGSHERTTIVTGPNASGKSIYLKQIGLIIYLSQIGSFVPAEKAIVGPVDAIYVTSADDFNQGDCSAYSLSLNTASIAMKHSTSRTTVLLDEFAHCINKVSSNRQTEAAALTVSIIEFFQRKKHPHLIASTHNTDIIENLKVQDTVKLILADLTARGSRKKLDTSKYRDVLSKLEHVDTNRMTTDLFRLLKSIERVLS
ncbi:DNA mismatch repair protein MSH5, partial [Paragonimus westermani]